MRDKHECGAVFQYLAHAVQATLLECGVTDREHLIDQQDVGLEESGNGKPQPHLHACRVELHLAIDRLAQLGELDDGVEPLGDVLASRPSNEPYK